MMGVFGSWRNSFKRGGTVQARRQEWLCHRWALEKEKAAVENPRAVRLEGQMLQGLEARMGRGADDTKECIE